MAVCLETGEVVAETLLTVSCRCRLRCSNPETGESEGRERPFRVLNPQCQPGPVSRPENAEVNKKRKCCGGRYVITLAIVTLMMLAPAYGITVWLLIECLYHLYTHSRPNMYRHPLHQFFFAEFCTYCQYETRMKKVGQLQDRRYRHYISNLPMGT
ncbi:Hypothetical protein NTJ_11456 [Nesidiocoris tenuis]|uniref:Uncharacterized protein n=1 Tax=Nesidiocoris tenuis TaxID=355587 RepID=A0ABN7B649_9HEMI|nr:Hypothetical protein NTJ_11456 [Nesidiocoris tenuis]